MHTYLATFYTHYGAMRFHRSCQKLLVASKMMPVPRSLSASCGTCVQFESASWECANGQEDLEGCYEIVNGQYRAVR